MSNNTPMPSLGGASISLRVLAAIPRSGSTLFMRVFREAPACAVTSRLILMGKHGCTTSAGQISFEPDYTIFQNPGQHVVYQKALQEGYKFLVSKEELGHELWKGECDYQIFPDAADYEMAKPAFLFRDPVRIFDSWKYLGWSDIDSFITCYTHLYDMRTANLERSIAIIYEEVLQEPVKEFNRLCDYWNIPFPENMLSFIHPFGDFFFQNDREKNIYTTKNPLGLFNTVISRTSIDPHVKSHDVLSREEIEDIEVKLGPRYIRCYEDRLATIKEKLHGKSWFGIDLDDTIHEFRKASGAASLEIFRHIVQMHSSDSVTIEDLRVTYSSILIKNTAGAFTDGKSSETYRKERFSALMEAHSIPFSPDTLSELAALYRTSLKASLKLKAGALDLLRFLKSLGKKVIVVTEGPEDAQIWTVENLGISGYVDELITTNRFGVAKTNGLFSMVLQHLNINAQDMVYIGDNFVRDVEPARKEGILAVHYDEKESVRFTLNDLKINSLRKLEYILSC